MRRFAWLLMPIPVLTTAILAVLGACAVTLSRSVVGPPRVVVLSILAVPAAVVAGYALWTLVRFGLPVEWRLSNPRWDAWLCARGSHRCVTCSRGCCAVCVRCDEVDREAKGGVP